MTRLGRTAELMTAGMIALGALSAMLVMPGHAETRWATSSHMIQDQIRAEGDVRPLSPEASRVALTALARQEDPLDRRTHAALIPAAGQRLDLGQAGSLEIAVVDRTGQARFSPDTDPRSPVVLDRGRQDTVLALDYRRVFEQPGQGDALDVSFTPRAGVRLGPDGSIAGAGAEVRIGQYLRGNEAEEPRWYVFAGADRQALMYNPREGMDFSAAMQLTDRQVVGDAQAGIAMRVGDVDLSLAYVRREYAHAAGMETFDETEEFGAVSVNWTW